MNPPPTIPNPASSRGAGTSSPRRRLRARWRQHLPTLIPLVGACLLLVLASFLLFIHSGAFWRDELTSIQLAKLPTIVDMYACLERDSAPMLFVCVLKGWMGMNPGCSDTWVAAFGFLIFAALGGALVWSTRVLGVRISTFGIMFLLLNGELFYWGTSIRSYGLAALLAALLVGCVWRLVVTGSRGWWFAAASVAVLAAHANYQNAYVIFSVCVAGAAVCAMRRQWQRGAAILLTGGCAALSLIIYLPILAHASAWSALYFASFNPVMLAKSIVIMMGGGRFWLGVIWLLLSLWLVGLTLYRSRNIVKATSLGHRGGRIMFAGLTVVLLFMSVAFFVWKVGHAMAPWYFLPSFSVLACFLDLPLQSFRRRRLVAWCIAIVGMLLLLAQASGLLAHSVMRRTNLDIIATQLGQQADSRDLIVVSPWWLGHAFKFYYQGDTAWVLAPGLTSEDVEMSMNGAVILLASRHPYSACSSLLKKIEKTLRAGQRVWVVGHVRTPQGGQLPAPPKSPELDVCTDYWGCVMGLYLAKYATAMTPLQAATTAPVLGLENLPVRVYSGWRE